MRIKFLCIIICLFVNALVFASATNHTITGVVISGEDNEPLIGASVYVHADDLKKAGVSQTSLGTITDIDGKFSISVPEKVTRIHCSYIGFEEQVNPEKPDVPLNKNDAFQKVQKRHVQEKR